MKPLKPQPIRQAIYLRLLEGIVAGQFIPGTRIKDTEVAEQLGVSRTPAREALLRLAQEGFLVSRPSRGFVVGELLVSEIEEVYPIIWALECQALRSTPPLTAAVLKRLTKLSQDIGAPDQDPLQRLALDVEWHALLIKGYGNARIQSLIAQHKLILQRYLHAYILLAPRMKASLADHEAIIEHMTAGNIEAAAQRLEEHYRRNMTVLIETLEQQ